MPSMGSRVLSSSRRRCHKKSINSRQVVTTEVVARTDLNAEGQLAV